MRKNLIVLFLVSIAILFSSTITEGQNRGDVDELFNDKGNFASRLWYGGGFTLGFSSTNVRSSFVVGVSPMVGYKIFEDFSIGPKGSATLSVLKGTTLGGETVRASPVSYSYGLFSRYKLFPAVFFQVEYEFEDAVFFRGDQFGFPVKDADGKMAIARQSQNNFFIGGGYNSSMGVWGYEIVILYNLNDPDNSIQNPIDLRFGINYNF